MGGAGAGSGGIAGRSGSGKGGGASGSGGTPGAGSSATGGGGVSDASADSGGDAAVADVATNSDVTSGGGATKTPREELLRLSLRFYAAERCGNTGNPLLAGNPDGTGCHLKDGETVGLDLAGGWHDAGDHVKVTLTIGYAAYVMLKAYEAFPGAFDDRDDVAGSGKPNGVPDVLDEAQVGLDWLVKAHPDDKRMVAMVADPDMDHARFVNSAYQSKLPVNKGGDPRPVQMGAKADFAGQAAAALALASKMYAKTDATRAATYLAKARTAYDFAKANRGISDAKLYAWAGLSDTSAVLCAAVELWRATDEAAFLTDAKAQDAANGPTKNVAGYGQISDFCRYSLVKTNNGGTAWKTDVNGYPGKVSNAADLKGQAYFSPWGSNRYAMTSAFSAGLFYSLDKTATKLRDFALGQLSWIEGQNPYNRSMVTGWGTNPPTHPHHRNAWGYTDDPGWIDPAAPTLDVNRVFLHALQGGLVGGPNDTGKYQDIVNDYQRNEVAIDYNAGLVGAVAFAVAVERGLL